MNSKSSTAILTGSDERRHWRPRDFGLHEYEFELKRPVNRHERRAEMKKTKKGKKKGKAY